MKKAGKKNVALVLSGGGARGMAHIGAIKTLEKNGYRITSLAGTSIGSLIGGVYLSGNLKDFEVWVIGFSKFDVIRLMDFALTKNGIIKGEKVFKELKTFLFEGNIEDLDRPYAALAVDIKNHREVVFRTGKLIKAIRASVSVPTVIRPVKHKEVELVDGGILNPLPLEHVHRSGTDLLVAVDLNTDIPYHASSGLSDKNEQAVSHTAYEKAIEFINEKWSKYSRSNKVKSIGYFDLITQSIYTMQMKLTQLAIEKHKPDLVIEISKNSCDIFEFHRAEELIKYGSRQTENALSKLATIS